MFHILLTFLILFFYKLVLYSVIVFIVVLVPIQPTKTELIGIALDLNLGGAQFVSRSGYRTS
jgi:hypothetical protein